MSAKVSRERPSTATVDTIMLHFCSLVVVDPENPYNIDKMLQVFESAPASAHYLIDRDGTVYRLVPEKLAASHAGRGELPFSPSRKDALNAQSIVIEMFGIGSRTDMKMFMSEEKYDQFAAKHPEHIGFTDAQYQALNQLIEQIISRNPHIKRDRFHIVGHNEYAPTRRTDPGELFDWSRIGLPRNREQR